MAEKGGGVRGCHPRTTLNLSMREGACEDPLHSFLVESISWMFGSGEFKARSVHTHALTGLRRGCLANIIF
jgi:hypothetical protein